MVLKWYCKVLQVIFWIIFLWPRSSLVRGERGFRARTDVEANPPEQNGCVRRSTVLQHFPCANSRSNMNFMSSSGRELRFFLFSLVSVLNIFIFLIGVCFFPQGRCLTHWNLWLQLLPEKTNEAFARLVQILRVAAEAAGRFSPHETLFIMRDAVFSWASEALELELGSSRTVLLKVFLKALSFWEQ